MCIIYMYTRTINLSEQDGGSLSISGSGFRAGTQPTPPLVANTQILKKRPQCNATQASSPTQKSLRNDQSAMPLRPHHQHTIF